MGLDSIYGRCFREHLQNMHIEEILSAPQSKGADRLALLQNAGTALVQTAPPWPGGGRAAVWADYNADGRPDLLLATPAGPKLFANLGNGTLRDDSRLPSEPAWNLTAAAWMDFDGDGLADLLLGNGFHGLRLYRNKGKGDPLWFEGVSNQVGLGPDGIGSQVKRDALVEGP